MGVSLPPCLVFRKHQVPRQSRALLSTGPTSRQQASHSSCVCGVQSSMVGGAAQSQKRLAGSMSLSYPGFMHVISRGALQGFWLGRAAGWMEDFEMWVVRPCLEWRTPCFVGLRENLWKAGQGAHGLPVAWFRFVFWDSWIESREQLSSIIAALTRRARVSHHAWQSVVSTAMARRDRSKVRCAC